MRLSLPLHWLAALALGWGAIEIASALVYRWGAGTNPSWAELLDRPPGLGRGMNAVARMAPPHLIPHPFLGYVVDPRRARPNELGFWSSARPPCKRSKGAVMIGVFGGSVAAMFASRGAADLIRTLAADPRFSRKRIKIVSAALGGYKQPQQLLALNYLLALGSEFDVVINLDGFNEVALPPVHLLPKGISPAFPAFPIAWAPASRLLEDTPTRRVFGRLALLETGRETWDRIFVKLSPLPSPALISLWRVGASAWDGAVGRSARTLELATSGVSLYPAGEPVRPCRSKAQLYADLAELWMRSSLQMDRLCKANGIAYFHFLQPNQYWPGSKVLTAEERKTAFSPAQPYREGVEKGYPFLIAAGKTLSRAGVRFRDLTRLFAGRRETIYRDDCCHYNGVGNAVLAREIGRVMLGSVNNK